VIGLLAVRGGVRKEPPHEVAGYEPWDAATVEVAREIPVQSGGRVKPFMTRAGFLMLQLHGGRTMTIRSGGGKIRIGPAEWLLDALFRPELAKQLPTFRIDNSDLLEFVGIEAKDRRDRYSYHELEPGFERLDGWFKDLQSRAQEEPGFEMDREEKDLSALRENLQTFQGMLGSLEFAREGIMEDGGGDEAAGELNRMSYWLKVMPGVRERLRLDAADPEAEVPEGIYYAITRIDHLLLKAYHGIEWLPPYQPGNEEWMSFGRRASAMVGGQLPPDWERLAADAARLEALVAAHEEGPEAFRERLAGWQADLAARAAERGEGGKLASEVIYYNRGYFMQALVILLAGFVVAALGWLSPRSRWGRVMGWGAWIAALAGMALVAAGIVHRSYLMGRPPVGNLYDTIPFITGGGMLTLLVVEWMTRRRIALGVAMAVGILGLFLTRAYETGDAKDHMDPLVAVLRSNFWLATHVITITLGYSGGLIAAAMSHVYIYGRLFGLDRGDPGFRRNLTRIVYGLICFTLLFSLVGTVLGGIWANDSWGRFWGWDPKENGALLIVLWNLVILHGRLGGFLKEWGIHLASVFGAIVVAFSWWGVNMLGTGLHSYGFIKGGGIINWFYAFEGLVILFGGGYALWEKLRKPAAGKEESAAAEMSERTAD